MIKELLRLTSGLLVAGLLAGAAHAADQVPAHIAEAVADKGRPEADKARDADRKPAEALTFAGVKPGDKVIDFLPGNGYFTRIFAKAVAPKGHVLALSPAGTPEKFTAAAKAIAADPQYGDVSATEENVSALPPGTIDLFWTSQNYHDLHNLKDVNVADIDKAIFAVLKPGGVFIVLDHAAAPGSGFQATNTLHRIDPEAVKQEVESVGFRLVGESDLLKNPNDPHTAKVFDPSIRGKTDQFILKFEKPRG